MKTATAPMSELIAALGDLANRCRAMRWFGALFRVTVVQDIAAEVDAGRAVARDAVYAEQQTNLLNATKLEAILADGRVTADEVSELVAMASRERRSASVLHNVTEVLA